MTLLELVQRHDLTLCIQTHGMDEGQVLWRAYFLGVAFKDSPLPCYGIGCSPADAQQALAVKVSNKTLTKEGNDSAFDVPQLVNEP